MEIYLTKALASLILPPGGNIVLALLGLVLLIRYRALAVVLLLVSVCSLYALSTPIVAGALSARVESLSPYPLKSPGAKDAGAIVVLGGGRTEYAPEYGGQTVSKESLERVRYAARLYRKTGLPILVTGGTDSSASEAGATLMKTALQDDYKISVKWTEVRSRTTEENARYSAQILKSEGIGTVYLVSHAAHLPRGVASFKRYGIRAIPAPTAYRRSASGSYSLLDYFPSADSLDISADMLHELLGDVWYRLRYS